MKTLSIGQLKSLSTIIGNIAVAWFVIGIITPIFNPPIIFFNFVVKLLTGLIFSTIFAIISLQLVIKVKS